MRSGLVGRCVPLAATAVMLLTGCTSDAGWLAERPSVPSGQPDLAPLIDDDTVERIARHVESTLGSELVEWPTVTVRTTVPEQRTGASEVERDAPLLWNPLFRDALDLPSIPEPTGDEPAGRYLWDDREIVLNRRPSWTPDFAEDVLIHELAHAMDLRPFPDDRGGTSDDIAAVWARSEGLATLVELRWTQPDLPTFGGGLEGALVRHAHLRLGHEQRRRNSSTIPHEDRVSSLLPFVDLAVPLDWQAPVVDEPDLPAGAEVISRDVIGVRGLLEAMASPYVVDQIAATGWRGDATILYRHRGKICVASTLRFASEDAATAAYFALPARLAELPVDSDEIWLRSCEGWAERGEVPDEIDYQQLDSVMRLAVRVASVVRYDDPELAMCVARAEHLAPEYAGPKTWTRSETIDVIVRRTGECRRGRDRGAVVTQR